MNLTEELSRLERETLLQAFKRTGGNQAETARLLKMKRTTLVEKLKRHGINTDAVEENPFPARRTPGNY